MDPPFLLVRLALLVFAFSLAASGATAQEKGWFQITSAKGDVVLQATEVKTVRGRSGRTQVYADGERIPTSEAVWVIALGFPDPEVLCSAQNGSDRPPLPRPFPSHIRT